MNSIFLFYCCYCVVYFFFFFQAEDGIRDWSVTGVQTCALPILVHKSRDARRAQAVPKFPAAERDTLIKKYHPDYRENAYRPVKFGPNAGEKTEIGRASCRERV